MPERWHESQRPTILQDTNSLILLVYLICLLGIMLMAYLIDKPGRTILANIWIGGSFTLAMLAMFLTLGTGYGAAIQVIGIFLSSFIVVGAMVGAAYLFTRLESRTLKTGIVLVSAFVIANVWVLSAVAIAGVLV